MHNQTFASPQRISNLNQSFDKASYSPAANQSETTILVNSDGFSIENWPNKPDVWSNDERMTKLFAPFRNRDLNPIHYDNKLKFWKELIVSFCKENLLIQFDQKYLERCFVRQNIKPKCFDLVLQELQRERVICARDEALRPKPSGFVSLVMNKLVWSPLSWSTSYFSYSARNSDANANAIKFEDSANESNTFVLGELLENKAHELVKFLNEKLVIYRNIDTVLEHKNLLELLKDEKNFVSPFLNKDKDVDLVLRYLKANGKVLIYDHLIENKRLVKFTTSYLRKCEQITQIEICHVKLRDLERKIERELFNLTQQAQSLIQNQIKEHLKQNNKQAALKLLRKKKQLEQTLEQKENHLNNIQTLIHNIQQTDTNKLTYDVYNESASALKEANRGLDLDKIDQTIEKLQDLFETNFDVEEALAKSPLPNKMSFDDRELSLELESLLSEEESKETARQKTAAENRFKHSDLVFNMNSILENLPELNSCLNAEANKNESDNRNHVEFS